MKVLIIPDIHLKPWMFADADKIITKRMPDRVVCLGDLVDDWECENRVDLYQETLEAALKFEQQHSDTLWCFGNHDVAYLWNVWVSGTAEKYEVRAVALQGLRRLYHNIPEGQLAFVHRIDNVLFSHAGISRIFVQEHFTSADYDHTDRILAGINGLHREDLWNNDSPIWLRPQKEYCRLSIHMYKPRTFLQVVGHSPMKKITQEKNLLSCDVFSLCRDQTPYGTQEFCLLDTKTWEWKGHRVSAE